MNVRFLAVAAVLAGSVSALWAQVQVKVDEPWVRGTVAQQKATGAFMRLMPNQPVRLVAAQSPVAGVVEIHEMAMVNDVMKMRAIAGLDLPAGQVTELKPGGHHVMLMDLKGPLAKDTPVPLTLVFEDAQRQRFTVEVKAPARTLGAAAGQTHSHGHGHGGAAKGHAH